MPRPFRRRNSEAMTIHLPLSKTTRASAQKKSGGTGRVEPEGGQPKIPNTANTLGLAPLHDFGLGPRAWVLHDARPQVLGSKMPPPRTRHVVESMLIPGVRTGLVVQWIWICPMGTALSTDGPSLPTVPNVCIFIQTTSPKFDIWHSWLEHPVTNWFHSDPPDKHRFSSPNGQTTSERSHVMRSMRRTMRGGHVDRWPRGSMGRCEGDFRKRERKSS